MANQLREMRCSECSKKILRKSADGSWRLSSLVLKAQDDGTGVVAVCRTCKSEQPLPIMIATASPPAPRPRHPGGSMLRLAKAQEENPPKGSLTIRKGTSKKPAT